MNRKILKFLIFFLLIFFSTAYAQVEIPHKIGDPEEKELIKSQKIKSRTEWGYNYKFGSAEDQKKLIRRVFFDKDGNEIETEIFDTLGVVFNRVVNKYNIDDYLIERQFYRMERMAARVTNIYDENGLHVESGYYEYDGKVNHTAKIKYDDNGNIKEIIYLLPNNDLDLKFMYRYDSLGRKIESVEYSADGNATFKRKYKYNSANKLTEQTCFERNGERIEKIINKYNATGKKIRTSWINDEDIRTVYTVYKYDNKNNLLESISYNGMDEPEYLIRYVYEFYEK
jgi:hypothetical protein